MNIKYETNQPISAAQFIDVLTRSTLGERRPIADQETMRGMVENTNLIITAWDGDLLIGVARSVTDFNYACYLSDLAVDESYQRQGIGKALIEHTAEKLGPRCSLLLVSAPDANEYYPKVGFEAVDRAWVLPRGKCMDG